MRRSHGIDITTGGLTLKMTAEDDSQFGRKLVEYRLVSPDEIALCTVRQQELESGGERLSLTDVLIREGYVTNSQLARLDRAMDYDSM